MKINNINQLIDILGKFKDLKRRGWLNKKVSDPESDAEHSFSVALLVLLLAPDYLDKQKCFELALTHDLAEIYAGDITPDDNIPQPEKHRKELSAIQRLSCEIDCPELLNLFNEFEQQTSKESLFVKILDKLDNVITAAYYDKNNRSEQKLTPEFKQHATTKITQSGCDKIFLEIKQLLDLID